LNPEEQQSSGYSGPFCPSFITGDHSILPPTMDPCKANGRRQFPSFLISRPSPRDKASCSLPVAPTVLFSLTMYKLRIQVHFMVCPSRRRNCYWYIIFPPFPWSVPRLGSDKRKVDIYLSFFQWCVLRRYHVHDSSRSKDVHVDFSRASNSAGVGKESGPNDIGNSCYRAKLAISSQLTRDGLNVPALES
jgi:hypothetical protein